MRFSRISGSALRSILESKRHGKGTHTVVLFDCLKLGGGGVLKDLTGSHVFKSTKYQWIIRMGRSK